MPSRGTPKEGRKLARPNAGDRAEGGLAKIPTSRSSCANPDAAETSTAMCVSALGGGNRDGRPSPMLMKVSTPQPRAHRFQYGLERDLERILHVSSAPEVLKTLSKSPAVRFPRPGCHPQTPLAAIEHAAAALPTSLNDSGMEALSTASASSWRDSLLNSSGPGDSVHEILSPDKGADRHPPRLSPPPLTHAIHFPSPSTRPSARTGSALVPSPAPHPTSPAASTTRRHPAVPRRGDSTSSFSGSGNSPPSARAPDAHVAQAQHVSPRSASVRTWSWCPNNLSTYPVVASTSKMPFPMGTGRSDTSKRQVEDEDVELATTYAMVAVGSLMIRRMFMREMVSASLVAWRCDSLRSAGTVTTDLAHPWTSFERFEAYCTVLTWVFLTIWLHKTS